MKYKKSKHRRTLSSLPEQPGLKAETTDEYQRIRDLPRLIAMWPSELTDTSKTGTVILIRKLKNALRAERQRGRAGHWSYDLGRHMGLTKALKAEMAAFALDQAREVDSAKPHAERECSPERLNGIELRSKSSSQ